MTLASWSPASEDSGAEALWNDHYHLVAHRNELPAQGSYLRFKIGPEDVVVYNDGQSLLVFDNRCPHRGTKIFDEHFGNRRFVCPYHGWSLIKGRWFIPAGTAPDDLDRSEIEVSAYKQEWIGEFLFITRGAPHTANQQLGQFGPYIESLSASFGNRRDFNASVYRCNWKIAVENALDQNHVSHIHSNTLNRLALLDAEVHSSENVFKVVISIGDDRLNRSLKRLRRLFDLEIDESKYFYVYLFPFTFISSTYGYSFSIQQFYPRVERDMCEFYSRFYEGRLAKNTDPAMLAGFFDSAIVMNRQVFEEDGDICRRIDSTSWSPQPPRFATPDESKIVDFRKAARKYYGSAT